MAPGDSLDIARLRELLGRARQEYGWILLDLPAIFHRATLLALPEADWRFWLPPPSSPACTWRARPSIFWTARLRQRPRAVLVNRVARRSGLAPRTSRRSWGAVSRSFPNDYPSLDRALAEGEPLEAGCELAAPLRSLPADWLRRPRPDGAIRRGIRSHPGGGPSMNATLQSGQDRKTPLTWDQRILQNAAARAPRSARVPGAEVLAPPQTARPHQPGGAGLDRQPARAHRGTQALVSLMDGEPTLLSALDKQQVIDECWTKCSASVRSSRCSRTPPSPTFWSTRIVRSTWSARATGTDQRTFPRRPAPAPDHRQDRFAGGRRIDESTPMVDARLSDGSRVNAVIARWPLTSRALDPPLQRRQADAGDLVEKRAMMPSMMELLEAAVRARLNIIVAAAPARARPRCSTRSRSSFRPRNASSQSKTRPSCNSSSRTWCAWRRGLPTWRGTERCASASCSSTASACVPTVSSAARCAVRKRSTCCRP